MSNVSTHQRLVPIAPAAMSQPSASPPTEATMPYTCLMCTRRKVKCDKLAPVCSTCRKSSLECVYQAPAPRKRKRKPVDEMHDRLEHYEKLLKQSGILPQDDTTPQSDTTPEGATNQVSTDNETDKSKSEPKIGHLHRSSQGKARFINGGFWRNMEPIEYDPSDEDEDGDDDPEPPMTGVLSFSTRDPVSSALVGFGLPAVSLIQAHPTYEAATKMWRLYVDNVDPVCKVLHVPTTQKMLQRAASNPSTATKSTEAVLFAIYNMAIESTSENECEEMFNQPRSSLKSRYLDAVRQALVNAQFLKTTDLSVLQAYILFLLSMRGVYDPSTFWVLTGVATRIGQRMGLHQAGLDKELNPFDVQIRRRVFWQLLPLDGIASQQSGTGIAIPFGSWDTEQPLNINDEDIWPGMDHEPQPRDTPTSMIFCLARTELAKYLQNSSRTSNDWARLWEADDFEENQRSINEIRTKLEEKYVRYCDISEPVHCLTLLMTRAASHMGMFRVRMHLIGRGDASDQIKMDQWNTAVKCLDTDITANTNPLMKGYRWHLQAITQWEPLIWVLYELQRKPAVYNNDTVWGKVAAIFENHPEIYLFRRALHVAVGRLALKAWAACRAQLEVSAGVKQSDPVCIVAIREGLHKREQSRNSKSTPTSTEPYNPFDPTSDASADLPQPVPADFSFANGTFAGFGDFGGMAGMDTSDWMFWDQMINDPNAYSLS